MHIIIGAAALVAASTGVVVMAPSLVQEYKHYVPTAGDRALAWREASGPSGERDSAALPLYQAVIDGDVRQVRALLISGAEPNRLLYPTQWSVLMAATSLNKREIAKLLLDQGANLNYMANDPASPTPLAAALTYGIPHQDFSIFHDFLNRGADLNVRYLNGEDIAVLAAVLGQMKLVNELLQRGYRGNLPELLKALEIIQVDEPTELSKQQALATVKRLLADKPM